LEVTGDISKEILHMKKKFTFWKAEKKADPTLNAKSVGLWLATVATTMVVTWLLAPAKKQECCKEAEAEPKKESKDEPAEEAKVDSVVESADVSEAEEVPEETSEEKPEEVPEEDSVEEPKEESEGESEETSEKEKLKESFRRFRGTWKNKKAKRGEQRKE
jgi:hypothetical protein